MDTDVELAMWIDPVTHQGSQWSLCQYGHDGTYETIYVERLPFALDAEQLLHEAREQLRKLLASDGIQQRL